MRNVCDSKYRETQTHFMFNIFFSEIVPFMTQCCKMWYRQATDDTTTRCLGVACSMTKTRHTHTHTHTHTEYEIVIACVWQQWLRESASLLRYKQQCRTGWITLSCLLICNGNAQEAIIKTVLRNKHFENWMSRVRLYIGVVCE